MTTVTRSFAINGGVRIAYQVAGTGPNLVLHHGFSRSSDRWRLQGYVDSLAAQFRTILIDARGHGASDKPHEPGAYDLVERIADVLAVMNTEGIAAAHHWGYSMGGQVCYRLAVAHPERVHALIIGGMHPYTRDPASLTKRIDELQARGVAGFTGLFEREFGSSTDAERAQLDRNDPLALAAVTTAIRDDPGLADEQLRTIELPTLIYCGGRDHQFLDGSRRAAAVMPSATFVEIPGCDHMAAQNPNLVLPVVVPFLEAAG